jgi:hypothetical protein
MQYLSGQTSLSHVQCIYIIYHTNDTEDGAFFKRTLEESYRCQVYEYEWDGISPLKPAIRSHTAESAFLILFVFSNEF